MTQQKNWQSAINSQLTQRLIRPLIQPGIISFAGATEIIQRSQRLSSRHPLLNSPRWSTLKHLEGEKVPIVHAQVAVARDQEVQQPGVKRKEAPVIQAKRVIEPKQALESQNKLNYPQSQPKSPTAISTSQSPATDSSNLVIQRKLDSSAPQFHSQITPSPSTPSHHNWEESSSLDGEISLPVIPKPPASDVVLPTSPLLPETEIILPQQQLNPLPLASNQNLSNSNLLNKNTDKNQFPSQNRELSGQQDKQPENVREKSKFSAKNTNNYSDVETSEVVNPLPVVKSKIIAQENNLTQLSKNKPEENSTAINYSLPVVQNTIASEENNFPQLSKSKYKQLDYPRHKEDTNSGKVDPIIESSSSNIKEDKLILKKVVKAQEKSNLSTTNTTNSLLIQSPGYNQNKTTQYNTLPIVKPKLSTNFQSRSTEKLSPSQLPGKQVIVNPQQIKSPQIKTPLIFSQGAVGQQTQENNNKRAISQPNNYQSATNKLSQKNTSETVVNQWLVNHNQQNNPGSQSQPKIDINAITNQVELRLKRRLIAESERRGRKFR